MTKTYERYKPSGVEWIGDIPEHWNVRRLKWFFQLNRGFDLSSDKFIEGNIPVFGSNGVIGYHNEATTKAPGITIGRSGSVGEVNFISQDFWAHNTSLFIHKNFGNDWRFIFYFLKTLDLKALFSGSVVGTLNRNYIHDEKVAFPSIPEQTAIAQYLDEKTTHLDRLIEGKRRLIALLKEERSGVINKAVTRGINPHAKLKPSGIDWLGEIPEHWEVKKLKYLVSKVGSGITPTGGANVYQQEGIPLLRSQNIYSDGLALEDIAFISEEIDEQMSNSRIQEEDILLNITGGSIGRCFYVPKGFGRGNVNQHVCIIRPIQSAIKTKFLHAYLISGYGQNLVDICQTGANREGLNFQQIKSFDIPVCEVAEQKQIVQFIEAETGKIDATITKIEKEIEYLQEYRAALISEIVTGKIDVRHLANGE